MKGKSAIVPQLRRRPSQNQASPSIFMGENGCLLSLLWHRPCDGEDDVISTFKSDFKEDQHDQNCGFIDGRCRVVRLYKRLGASAGIGSGSDRPTGSTGFSGHVSITRSSSIDGSAQGRRT
jgi:hypothetical protein